MQRPIIASALILSGGLLGLVAMPAGSTSEMLLPDLTTFGSHIQRTKIRRSRGQVRLHFGVPVVNVGRGPLEMLGTRETTQEELRGTQVVYTSDGGKVTFDLGEWVYHDIHRHWHVADVADYRLLDASGNVVGRTPKVSYFLEDTRLFERALPGAPRRKVYRFRRRDRSRNSRFLRTGISVGWADVYDASVPGQYIDVTGLPKGDYILQVEVNPSGTLMESDRSNNVVSVPVKL